MGWPGQAGAPVLSPWTKAVCTHVISTNYPGFSKLAADSQLDSQAAQSYCPCTSALSKSLGTALISKPSTSPPLARAPLGLCCCHVLTSDLLCVFASIRLERPPGQVRKATCRRAKARVLCCEGRQRQPAPGSHRDPRGCGCSCPEQPRCCTLKPQAVLSRRNRSSTLLLSYRWNNRTPRAYERLKWPLSGITALLEIRGSACRGGRASASVLPGRAFIL